MVLKPSDVGGLIEEDKKEIAKLEKIIDERLLEKSSQDRIGVYLPHPEHSSEFFTQPNRIIHYLKCKYEEAGWSVEYSQEFAGGGGKHDQCLIFRPKNVIQKRSQDETKNRI